MKRTVWMLRSHASSQVLYSLLTISINTWNCIAIKWSPPLLRFQTDQTKPRLHAVKYQYLMLLVLLHHRFNFLLDFLYVTCSMIHSTFNTCLGLEWCDKFYLKHIHLGESCTDEQIHIGQFVLHKLSQLECCVDAKNDDIPNILPIHFFRWYVW